MLYCSDSSLRIAQVAMIIGRPLSNPISCPGGATFSNRYDSMVVYSESSSLLGEHIVAPRAAYDLLVRGYEYLGVDDSLLKDGLERINIDDLEHYVRAVRAQDPIILLDAAEEIYKSAGKLAESCSDSIQDIEADPRFTIDPERLKMISKEDLEALGDAISQLKEEYVARQKFSGADVLVHYRLQIRNAYRSASRVDS